MDNLTNENFLHKGGHSGHFSENLGVTDDGIPVAESDFLINLTSLKSEIMGFGHYIMTQQRGRPLQVSVRQKYRNKSVKEMFAELVGITNW